jgi:hypothetical protein
MENSMRLDRVLGIPALLFGSAAFLTMPAEVRAQEPNEAVAGAVRPLPTELRDGATVFRYDPETGARVVMREGTNGLECSPPDDAGFTRCYPTSSAAWRDLRAALAAEGLEGEALGAAMAEAVAEGRVQRPPFGSMAYRLSEESDRIQLLWMVLVPGATAADLAMPTGSQRDASLAGRGTPWMMNEGTPGAHLMIPINGTDFSNPGAPAELLDARGISDPVEQATLPLPEDLRAGATVSMLDPTTGERRMLREGTNTLECRPRNEETGYTRCYHRSVWLGRDLAARLRAEGRSEEDISEAMAAARADGSVPATTFGSLAYRLYEEDDRIRLLWMVRVPGATSAELGMPTGPQRDAALAGRGTPWMMNEGTPGAHLMIPINGTELSNR